MAGSGRGLRARDLPHLARRFLGDLRPRFPGPADQHFVAEHLKGAAARLFYRQQVADQAHGVAVARRVEQAGGDGQSIRAALLHDVGKTEPALGTISRSLASMLSILRLPVRGRWRRYLDHGALGAEVLSGAGEPPLVIAFARSHHDPRVPEGIPAATWQMLREADRG